MARNSGAKRPRGKPRQLKLPLPANVFVPGTTVIVKTDDLDLMANEGAEECLRRTLAVPLDKSILLDFLVGRLGKKGERTVGEKTQLDGLTDDQIDWWRLQRLMNSQWRGKRFDWLGDSLTARMARQAIRDMPDFLASLRKKVGTEDVPDESGNTP